MASEPDRAQTSDDPRAGKFLLWQFISNLPGLIQNSFGL